MNKTKSTVVFEMTDMDREQPVRYVEPFIDFLKSLGFPVDQTSHINDYISIDGVNMTIDASCATLMGEDAFTRKRKPRVNRFVALRKMHSTTGPSIIRVTPNKEYDADILRNKIEKAIIERKQIEKDADDQKSRQSELFAKIGRLFSIDKEEYGCSSITIHKGELFLSLEGGVMTFDATGKFTQLQINGPAYKPQDVLSTDGDVTIPFTDTIAELGAKVRRMITYSALMEWGQEVQDLINRGYHETLQAKWVK